MVNRETVVIFTGLLFDRQKLFLREPSRALFFTWLRNHTKIEIHLDTFKEKLAEWLLKITDPQELYGEILLIHSEILWLSHLPCMQEVKHEN